MERQERKKREREKTPPLPDKWAPCRFHPWMGTLSLSGPAAPACSQGWNKRCRWTILRLPSLPPSPFIHRRVIGSQFELPLCPLWTHFPPTECGRLMAKSSQKGVRLSKHGRPKFITPISPCLALQRRKREGGRVMARERMVNERNKR